MIESMLDALRRWPETATAIGVRLDEDNQLDFCAAYGLEDLFESNRKGMSVINDLGSVGYRSFLQVKNAQFCSQKCQDTCQPPKLTKGFTP
ncbi:Nucleotidyltransferase [Paenibacillus sp. cl6col]|nr:Nucleotidyltransferase [Paenibacillus sp. cl6col]